MEKKFEALLSDGCIPTYGPPCISFKLDLHEQFEGGVELKFKFTVSNMI